MRSRTFKSENLEIRRFVAVLEKKSWTFKNSLHQITTISVSVVDANFESDRIRALGGVVIQKFG